MKTIVFALLLLTATVQAADNSVTIGLPNGYRWNALTVPEQIAFVCKLEEAENISFGGETLSPTEIAKRITVLYTNEPANMRVPIMLIKCSVIDTVKGQTMAAAGEDRQTWQRTFPLEVAR